MDTPTPTPDPIRRDAENDVDPCTSTGAYRILVKRQYGKRRGDKPLWWVFSYHLVKALGALLPYAVAAAIFRACGFDFQGGSR